MSDFFFDRFSSWVQTEPPRLPSVCSSAFRSAQGRLVWSRSPLSRTTKKLFISQKAVGLVFTQSKGGRGNSEEASRLCCQRREKKNSTTEALQVDFRKERCEQTPLHPPNSSSCFPSAPGACSTVCVCVCVNCEEAAVWPWRDFLGRIWSLSLKMRLFIHHVCSALSLALSGVHHVRFTLTAAANTYPPTKPTSLFSTF